MENILVWDIETIPQVEEFSALQKEKIGKKVEYQTKNGMEEEEATRLVASTNPFYGHVICISMMEISPRYPDTNKTTLVANYTTLPDGRIVPDEKSLLEDFWTYIRDFNGVFVGFNSLKFDSYFIQIRSMLHNITPTNMSFLDFRLYQTKPHYDIMQQLSNWNWVLRPTLDLACDFFGIPTPKEGTVKASTVAWAFQNKMFKEIAEYALRDVEATYTMYKITKKYVRK